MKSVLIKILPFCVLVGLGVLLVILDASQQMKQPPEHALNLPEPSVLNVPLPVFEATTLEGLNVKDLGQLPEETLFIHFWATWCAPCLKEFPELIENIRLYNQKNDNKIGLVTLSTDETLAPILPFLKRQKVLGQQHVYHFHDSEKAWGLPLFNVLKVPHTFVVDQQRVIRFSLTGPQVWSPDFIRSLTP